MVFQGRTLWLEEWQIVELLLVLLLWLGIKSSLIKLYQQINPLMQVPMPVFSILGENSSIDEK